MKAFVWSIHCNVAPKERKISIHKDKQHWPKWIIYMVKQLPLLVLTATTFTAGAVLANPTPSHFRRAAGLGKFSGTMVSSEFTCHGGHALLSLHLFPFAFDSAIWCIFWSAIAMASPLPIIELSISSPMMMRQATPIMHWLFSDLSFFGLNKINGHPN